MKEISYDGFKFNIDPDDYYNVDYIQAYPSTISNYVSGSLMTLVGSVGSAIIWTPKIAKYLSVSDVPEMQWCIAGAVFVSMSTAAFGTSIEKAEKIYDSFRFTFDYNVAAIGDAYDSYGSASDAG